MTQWIYFLTAISILVISNHNSVRVLFYITASVYFVGKIYLYFIIRNSQRGGTLQQHAPYVRTPMHITNGIPIAGIVKTITI